MDATIAEPIGPEWTLAMEGARRELLGDLDFFFTHPDQSAKAKVA
jgi:hypothetical protein